MALAASVKEKEKAREATRAQREAGKREADWQEADQA
jgi:hypothetical protein